MQKQFYAVTQSSELPGLNIKEHKGVIFGKHLADAQYGYNLSSDFQDKAERLGANAVIDVKTSASDEYFVFTGTAVVVEPVGL